MRLNPSMVSMVAVGFVFAASATADTKIKLDQMHLCCGSCVKGVAKAVKTIDGVTHTVDKKAGSIELTAPDDASAQKAIDAIAAAGYHGRSNDEKIKFKEDSGAPDGKVKKLTVSNIHNCCGGCSKAFIKAVTSVDGAQKPTVTKKAKTFEVSGEFLAKALVQALNAAGFHVKVQ